MAFRRDPEKPICNRIKDVESNTGNPTDTRVCPARETHPRHASKEGLSRGRGRAGHAPEGRGRPLSPSRWPTGASERSGAGPQPRTPWCTRRCEGNGKNVQDLLEGHGGSGVAAVRGGRAWTRSQGKHGSAEKTGARSSHRRAGTSDTQTGKPALTSPDTTPPASGDSLWDSGTEPQKASGRRRERASSRPLETETVLSNRTHEVLVTKEQISHFITRTRNLESREDLRGAREEGKVTRPPYTVRVWFPGKVRDSFKSVRKRQKPY